MFGFCWPAAACVGDAVRLAVAVGVSGSVLFCDVFFPTGCLG